MAPQSRRNGIDLIASLEAEPYRFSFFQAVRVLKLTEAWAGREAALPSDLRFRTPLSLACPPSEIHRFGARPSRETAGVPREMEVGFLGLTGPSGVLPHPYTEALMEGQSVQREVPAHAFFDLFNHRALSLFYEAWQKYRFHIAHEMGIREGLAQHLLDLLGTGLPGLRDGEGLIPVQVLVYFSGLLGRRPLPSSSLAALLEAYFEVEVTLEQFAGRWVEVPPEEQSSLGGAGCALGPAAMLGRRVWDRQTKIRLRLGPLDRSRFQEFQPGRSAASALRQLVETCCGQALDCDVVLVLEKEAVPPCVLDSRARIPLGLGISTWIRTAPPEQDPDDVRFRLL